MINTCSIYSVHTNKKSSMVNITPAFCSKKRTVNNISGEMQKVLKSKNKKAISEYLSNFSQNAKLIFKTATSKDVVKTVQLLINDVSTKKIQNNTIFKNKMQIIYSGLFPKTGVDKHIKIDQFEKKYKYFLYNDKPTAEMIKDILSIKNPARKKIQKDKMVHLMPENLDISYRAQYPLNILSNFAKTNFKYDGVEINSMEGFLQSLKCKDSDIQKEICLLDGPSAKGIGKKLNKKRNYDFKHLYWQGEKIDRESSRYQQLLKDVYKSRYDADEEFRFALAYTEDRPLTHSLGTKNPKNTLLSEKEYIEILKTLRKNN